MTRSPLNVRAARSGLLLLAALLPGCANFDQTADLASNEVFYVDVAFRTKAPGDRPVFVTPLRDNRRATKLPEHEQGFPITYGEDSFWERPVTEMVGEVLQRQLDESELFPEVAARATPAGLVLRPTLIAFTTGAKEELQGARSFAEVGLRVEVLGPAGQGGRREVLYDETFGNRQVSEASLRPISPYLLIGRALRVTMSEALVAIDGSNIGRSNVPLEVPALDDPSALGDGAAAEASTDKR